MVRYDIWYADGPNGFELIAVNHFYVRAGNLIVVDCFSPYCKNLKKLGSIEVSGDAHLLSDHFPVSGGHYKVGLKFNLDGD